MSSVRSFSGLGGSDLAIEVTCDSAYEWTQPTWSLNPEALNRIELKRTCCRV